MTWYTSIVIMALCMLAYAFFSGMETGIISVHRMRLRHYVRRGSKGASRLHMFIDSPDRLLGTTLVGQNFALVVVSVIAASLTARLFGAGGKTASSILISLLLLLFCEYLPKLWFRQRPMERCRRFVGLLRAAELVFSPVAKIIVALSRIVVPGAVDAFKRPMPFVTREDIKILARQGEKDGVLSSRERAMIQGVVELQTKTAADLMEPREKLAVVYDNMIVEDFFEKVKETGFSRMPVRDHRTDSFVGVINFFYVLFSDEPYEGRLVMDFARTPLFVPHQTPADDILPLLRRHRQPMGLVVDDAGEVLGGITTEDVLEEIVGDL